MNSWPLLSWLVFTPWVGALLVMDHTFSVGMLFAFIAFKEQFAQRVSALIDKGVELRMLRLQGERLADIVLTAPEAPSPAQSEKLLDPNQPMTLEAALRGGG